jgi:hypothetical protein
MLGQHSYSEQEQNQMEEYVDTEVPFGLQGFFIKKSHVFICMIFLETHYKRRYSYMYEHSPI